MPLALFGQVEAPGIRGMINLGLIAIAVLAGMVLLVIIAKYFSLWIQAKSTGAGVGMLGLIGMTLRKVDPAVIVRCKIMGIQSGLSEIDGMTTRGLEAHYLAGGKVQDVIRALIAAQRADIPLTFKRATAIDLAGRDVLAAVRTSVNPRVIDCPDPAKGRETIDGVAQDGIQLKVKVRVTVRTELGRLVGGATEETIIARVGEGIVTTIGSAATYKLILSDPAAISHHVLAKGLDAGTAYEILSIDIAAIDVGENIGANLQASQAEADMGVARAKAEGRRTLAVAFEQEMIAAIQEQRARVVLAEVDLAKQIASTFRTGKSKTGSNGPETSGRARHQRQPGDPLSSRQRPVAVRHGETSAEDALARAR